MRVEDTLRRLVAGSDNPHGELRKVKTELAKVDREKRKARRRGGLKGVAGG